VNRFGSFLAALALFAALFAPSGFMPARAADGSLVIRICSELDGGREKLMRLDPRTGTMVLADADGGGSESKRCDFANAGVADLPPLPAFTAPQAIFHEFAPAPMDALERLSATGLPPSTGPPHA
jgi:hypothetical protein